MQDLSRRSIATSGESVSTYPRRPKTEAFANTVDVVELLLVPMDQVPNVRHLRVQHTLVRVGPKQTVFNPFPRWHLEPSPSE